MKILIVGEWSWPQYEDAFARGLNESGAVVVRFITSHYFKGLLGRFQYAIPVFGPSVLRLNRGIIAAAKEEKPDLVLFWRPTHILPNTINELMIMGIPSSSYNNDDPFGPKLYRKTTWHYRFMWRLYLKCLPMYRYNFFYRELNRTEAIAAGAAHAEVLLPYFMPWRDRPVLIEKEEQKIYDADVVFVGHYEPDGREDCIRALVVAGLNVKIWGGSYWNRNVLGDMFDHLSPIIPAEGEEYSKALCGAKICLCFLSKLNRDTYTRRCFEIPACGKVMLAERTNDLVRLFKEDEEACFFSTKEELVDKAQWLINNPAACERIGEAGLRRVWKDGHDVAGRAKQFMSMISLSEE